MGPGRGNSQSSDLANLENCDQLTEIRSSDKGTGWGRREDDRLSPRCVEVQISQRQIFS